MNITIKNIDLSLLKDQIDGLIKLQNNSRIKDEKSFFEGVICLLESIKDTAETPNIKYYLLGEQACNVYREDFNKVQFTDFNLYKVDLNEPEAISLLLESIQGYFDFAEITKKEYDYLNNLH